MKLLRPVLSLAFMLGASVLQATPILPGQIVIPQILANPGEDVPVLDEIEANFNFGVGAGALFGEYEQGVLVDPFGLSCAGCLAFFYQVDVFANSTAGLLTVGGAGFAGYETSVAWILPEDEDGDGVFDHGPLDVQRSEDGDALLFRFITPAGQNVVLPGSSTAYLIISTNATSYDRSGTFGLIGGRQGEGSAVNLIEGVFAPAGEPANVPEPGTLSLLALGVLGLFTVRRRRNLSLAS